MPRLPWLMLSLLPVIASSQGTAEDYRRADTLADRLKDKVFRSRVTPRWLEGGRRFWYRVDTAPGEWETVLVDAHRGDRKAAFDHARLAEALTKATGKAHKADSLPVEILAVEPRSLKISLASNAWKLHLGDYRLEDLGPALDHAPTTSLPAFLPPVPSGGGEETSILLENRSKVDVDVFWVDGGGQRVKYRTLKPGESFAQHTFEDHVWLFADAKGKALAAFRAKVGAGAAVYDGTSPKPTVEPDPRLSPDGKWRAEIRSHDLWIRPVGEGSEKRLSTDGTASNPYRGPFVWSPDSRRLAVVRAEAGDRRVVTIVRSSPKNQLQPERISLDYLKPGDKIAHERLAIFSVDGTPTPVDESLTPNPWDLGYFHWAPDSSEIYYVYNQRGHQVLRLLAADAVTGKVRTVVEETSPTFIDYAGKLTLRYLDSRGQAVWSSERSGYNHLYLVDLRKGGIVRPLTEGRWMVRSIDDLDEKSGHLRLRVMGFDPEQDPYYIDYLRVGLEGGKPTRLTSGFGTHRIYAWAPDGESYLDVFSSVDGAPRTDLRRTRDGRLLARLENGEDRLLEQAGWQRPERFVAAGRDGTTPIYGVIYRPTNFDPKKRYPVIEDIYAGPQDFFVPKSFSHYTGQMKLAELGFIVVKIDGMGTNWRGKAFHDVCHQNLADSGLPDRILWMKAAAKDRPWMDLERVGIFGTSAGGQNAASAVLRFGDFYKAAVADCGCHDNRMDKIWWNELWMGWPVGPHYEANSNVTAAKNLTGKLFLMVGEVDSNVDPASTMQVANALVEAGKDFDLLVMPNVGHGVLGHPFAYRKMQDFFVRSLHGVEPRR